VSKDYDCFYASVFEAENPALRALPLAVQQKQIIVTCNYEARRRGLKKLQLISEAKKVCPDIVIVLGEQLDRFRDASKMLYKLLESFTWNKKVEKLGFDEVFLDVTDIVAYNQAMLNPNDLSHAFFHLSRDDPTIGFSFDATRISGYEYPEATHYQGSLTAVDQPDGDLLTRLTLGSHIASHLRNCLEETHGYTSTVGISTSKLLSKLAGNLHKPKAQTTLTPPYECPTSDVEGSVVAVSNVTNFIDEHEIGKIPGIGFKMSHKIRSHVLSLPTDVDVAWGEIKDSVTVRDVRTFPGMGPELLEQLLGGPGSGKGIGGKVWALILGIDDTEVKAARKVPSQISIEDSYVRLDTMSLVQKELRILSSSLIRRMHIDLLEDDEDEESIKRWTAYPKTIRLTTRPRPPPNSDGTRTRSFNRISRSGPLPNFVFSLREGVEALVEKLVQETLVPMFRRLHPENHRWNLSLINIGVTNMASAASNDGSGGGRDIGRMFKQQEEVLKEWKIEDRDVSPDPVGDGSAQETSDGNIAEPSAGNDATGIFQRGSEHVIDLTQNSVDDQVQWYDDEDQEAIADRCGICGAVMPAFAMTAHEIFHSLGDI
jgi:DNA polymerase iota